MLAKSIFVISLLLASAAAKPTKTRIATTKTTFVTVTPAPTTISLGPPCVGWQGDTTYCATRSGCWTYWKSGTADGRCINTAHE
ncbi:hypothetical protein TWF225_007108 [Orbilia oligospora]|nr:hypothetical protein TWF225_007108 [Orbilia oligospora]KAF3270073.1 hypothetical protein TWF217_008413 [Orbilia oligospora]KAF3270546.1 hypothetical protein TWF128_004302 [Orbilia oligospora]KAF3276487.1 hypothetical protein TWF132_002193 [Orbilia oligospora]